MQRQLTVALLLAAAALVPACDTVGTDNRPLELDYLTVAIFQPSCGATQCHSTFAQADGAVFDTPEAVRRTLVDYGWLNFNYDHYDPEEPNDSAFIRLISLTDPFGNNQTPRMPYDAPLPDKDFQLLRTWLWDPDVSPDGEGASARGAQCNPDAFGGIACRKTEVVECTADWNFGEVLATCAKGCIKELCPYDGPCAPMDMCRP